MADRDGYIPGVPCWVDCNQPDPRAAARFYNGLFGWEVEDVMPEGAGASYFMGRIRGGDVGGIGPMPDEVAARACWNTYVWVDDADAVADTARRSGGAATAPMDVMDAGRMAVLTDPEGATIMIWQAKRHRGSKVVNEHGSVNFNTLATRDLDRAKAFYGAVFGWQTLALPSGITWTLPTYGDHLEESTPGLREQMAQMGAPAGFIDVVAAVDPIADDDSTMPAQWTVTFAVDDVDATVAKARELGGTILTPPHDEPWSRQAVIADPQGATFVASQFVPENKDLVA